MSTEPQVFVRVRETANVPIGALKENWYIHKSSQIKLSLIKKWQLHKLHHFTQMSWRSEDGMMAAW